MHTVIGILLQTYRIEKNQNTNIGKNTFINVIQYIILHKFTANMTVFHVFPHVYLGRSCKIHKYNHCRASSGEQGY